MNEFNIDNYLKPFNPYFLSLRKVEGGYLVVDAEVPTNWEVGKLSKDLIENHQTIQVLLTGQDEQIKMIAIAGCETYHGFDALFTRLDKIVKVNQEREEKNKLFKIAVKRLEKLVIENNIDQLQKLIIDVEDEEKETELGNTDKAEIVTPPQVEESDEDVAAKITSKKDLIPKE